MAMYAVGLTAIAPQGENQLISKDKFEQLQKRFDNIVVVYDNDEAGINGAKNMEQRRGTPWFVFDDAKDFSDLIQLKGLSDAREEIHGKLRSLITPERS